MQYAIIIIIIIIIVAYIFKFQHTSNESKR
jgi:hypothetical protein